MSRIEGRTADCYEKGTATIPISSDIVYNLQRGMGHNRQLGCIVLSAISGAVTGPLTS